MDGFPKIRCPFFGGTYHEDCIGVAYSGVSVVCFWETLNQY